MIEARSLSVVLAGRAVVSELTFSARPGELTAIVGPNGSGKTTTLRTLSGDLPYRGTIRLNGFDLQSLSARALARHRGVLSQSLSLGFPFRVSEILDMGIVAGDYRDGAAAAARRKESLEAVDLAGFENRVATTLSGGEQTRMHLARILCQIDAPLRDGKPCWLFLDEPVASLDIRHQLAIMALAKAFATRGGGVIAVMHDLNLTSMFADRVVMLKAGRLYASGSPSSVMTEDGLNAVYDCRLNVRQAAGSGLPQILPFAP